MLQEREAWLRKSPELLKLLGCSDLTTFIATHCEGENYKKCKLYVLGKACSTLIEIQRTLMGGHHEENVNELRGHGLKVR